MATQSTTSDRDNFPPVIHVGYHKTGSTLLQRRVFGPNNRVYSEWSQIFYHQHILLDRPDRQLAERVRAAFAPGIRDAAERGLRPVLSCEGLSGDIWRAGQANGFANFNVADTLAEAFPNATIVIVHREQVAMISSLYKHSIRSHWSWSLEQFLDQTCIDRGMIPVFRLEHLEYSHLLSHYHELFGRDNVVAIPFELVRERTRWADEWSAVLGTTIPASDFDSRENPSMSGRVVSAKRWANRLIPEGADPNGTRTGLVINALASRVDAAVSDQTRRRSDQRLSERVRSLVGDFYAEDNARLRCMTGQDWSRYGY